MQYIVAYDIASDGRRRQVLHALRNYGVPVQFSVVECDLDAARLEQLCAELGRLIRAKVDRVTLYPQCGSCAPKAIRLGASRSAPVL